MVSKLLEKVIIFCWEGVLTIAEKICHLARSI